MKVTLFNVNEPAAYIAPPADSAVLLTKLVLLIDPEVSKKTPQNQKLEN